MDSAAFSFATSTLVHCASLTNDVKCSNDLLADVRSRAAVSLVSISCVLFTKDRIIVIYR